MVRAARPWPKPKPTMKRPTIHWSISSRFTKEAAAVWLKKAWSEAAIKPTYHWCWCCPPPPPTHPYREAAKFPEQPAPNPPDDPNGEQLELMLIAERVYRIVEHRVRSVVDACHPDITG